MLPISRVVFYRRFGRAIRESWWDDGVPELIRYPYRTISSDNGILGNWLSRAVTKSHIPRSGLIGTWAETEAIL